MNDNDSENEVASVEEMIRILSTPPSPEDMARVIERVLSTPESKYDDDLKVTLKVERNWLLSKLRFILTFENCGSKEVVFPFSADDFNVAICDLEMKRILYAEPLEKNIHVSYASSPTVDYRLAPGQAKSFTMIVPIRWRRLLFRYHCPLTPVREFNIYFEKGGKKSNIVRWNYTPMPVIQQFWDLMFLFRRWLGPFIFFPILLLALPFVLLARLFARKRRG